AARIGRQHVDAGLAFDDPLGELPPGTARGRYAEAVAFVDPDIAHAPGWTYHRTAVRRVGNRAVDDVLDAAALESGHAPHGRLDVRHQAIEIAREQALAEPFRDPVGKARRSTVLVRAKDPSHALLAQVVGLVGFPQYRQFLASLRAV